MSKKAGIVFVLIGVVLILAALLLFLHNESVDANAGQEAEAVLNQMQLEIPEEPEALAEETTAETISEEMTVVEIDGYGYIGYLSVEKVELELPIMSDWDYDRLKIAPCRHFGSTKTDNLVIAGHNYSNHFGRLSELVPGDAVSFTDMEGETISYEVVRLETLDPNAVDAVQYSDCDLVLYTCTYNGENRVSVFCNRTE